MAGVDVVQDLAAYALRRERSDERGVLGGCEVIADSAEIFIEADAQHERLFDVDAEGPAPD